MRVDTVRFLLALQSIDLANTGKHGGQIGHLAAMACDGDALWLVSSANDCKLYWRLPALYGTMKFPPVYIDVAKAREQLVQKMHLLGPEIKVEWSSRRIEYGPCLQGAIPRAVKFQPPLWFYEPLTGDGFSPEALRRVWLPILPAIRYFMQDGRHTSMFYGGKRWQYMVCADHTLVVRHAWGRPSSSCVVRPYHIATRAFPAIDIAMQSGEWVNCKASDTGATVQFGQRGIGWLLVAKSLVKDRHKAQLSDAYALIGSVDTPRLKAIAMDLTRLPEHTPVRLTTGNYRLAFEAAGAHHEGVMIYERSSARKWHWIVSSSALALSILSANDTAPVTRLFVDRNADELVFDQGDHTPVWAVQSYLEYEREAEQLALPAPTSGASY